MPLPVVNGAALLPTSNPLVQTRTGIATNVWLAWFRRTQGSIEELTTAITGTLATVLQDTHANRVAGFDPLTYDPGTLFYETDRAVFYIVNPANTAWVYAAGQMADTFANVPTDLGVDDEGFLLQITDYGHLVRWSGSAWGFAPGDPGNGYFQDFAVAPTVSGWKLCDGTATTYLTMGATITATAITPPNLSGSPAYRKSAAAYTGAISAAQAPGLTGSSGSTAPGISGNVGANTVNISGSTAGATATISGQTANASITTSAPSGSSVGVTIGTDDQVANATHDHTNTHLHDKGTLAVDSHAHGVGSLAGDSHDHGVGTLAVGAHVHAVGTLAVDATAEPARLGVLVYFRQ